MTPSSTAAVVVDKTGAATAATSDDATTAAHTYRATPSTTPATSAATPATPPTSYPTPPSRPRTAPPHPLTRPPRQSRLEQDRLDPALLGCSCVGRRLLLEDGLSAGAPEAVDGALTPGWGEVRWGGCGVCGVWG